MNEAEILQYVQDNLDTLFENQETGNKTSNDILELLEEQIEKQEKKEEAEAKAEAEAKEKAEAEAEAEAEVVEEVDLMTLDEQSQPITSEEFRTYMEDMIELQSVQVEALEHIYTAQIVSLSVLAVIFVFFILHKVIKIFM